MGVLKQITRCFHYGDKNVFLRLYTQYVRPHLEFATTAWSPWLTADKEKLEKVQEKAVKMISGLKGTRYEETCKELGIETLERRRNIPVQDMAQVYKLVHGIDKVERIKLFDHVPEGKTRLAADPLNM
jgi:predicted YcjX-like family ATPase